MNLQSVTNISYKNLFWTDLSAETFEIINIISKYMSLKQILQQALNILLQNFIE